VTGWAGFRATGEPADEVWVAAGEQILGVWPKIHFLPRPDVVSALGMPDLLQTGSSITLGDHPDISALRLLARHPDGRLIEISVEYAIRL
jgi:hypothetical protein